LKGIAALTTPVQKLLDRGGGGEERCGNHADEDVQDDPRRRRCSQLPPLEEPDDQQDGGERPDGTPEPFRTGTGEQEEAAERREYRCGDEPVLDDERGQAAAEDQEEFQHQR
jgi:hypothetical protein